MGSVVGSVACEVVGKPGRSGEGDSVNFSCAVDVSETILRFANRCRANNHNHCFPRNQLKTFCKIILAIMNSARAPVLKA